MGLNGFISKNLNKTCYMKEKKIILGADQDLPATGKQTLKSTKKLDPKVRLYIIIVLNCPLIGSPSSSTVNQRAAQNNWHAESDFGNPSICTT